MSESPSRRTRPERPAVDRAPRHGSSASAAWKIGARHRRLGAGRRPRRRRPRSPPIAAWQLNNQDPGEHESRSAPTAEPPPNIAAFEGGFNILLVGSDTREGQGGIGGNESSVLNDVTMLHARRGRQAERDRRQLPARPRRPAAGVRERRPGDRAADQRHPLLRRARLHGGDRREPDRPRDPVRGPHHLHRASSRCRTRSAASPSASPSRSTTRTPGCRSRPPATHTLVGRQRPGVPAQPPRRRRRQRPRPHRIAAGVPLVARAQDQERRHPDRLREALRDRAGGDARTSQLSSNFANLDTLVSVALVLKDIPLEHIVFVQYPSRDRRHGHLRGQGAADHRGGERAVRRDQGRQAARPRRERRSRVRTADRPRTRTRRSRRPRRRRPDGHRRPATRHRP